MSEHQTLLSREYRNLATWILSVITLPVGVLIFLAFKRLSSVYITIAEDRAGIGTVTVVGEVPGPIARRIQATAEQPAETSGNLARS